MIDLVGYNFLDFGTGSGACYNLAQKRLGGNRGLGFELSESLAQEAKNKGFDCVVSDITKLDLPNKAVNFVTISHVLEHLKKLQDVEKVINLAINTATDFVFIEGPSFDFDEMLKKHNLKFYWVGWTTHPTPVTTSFVVDICKKSPDVKSVDLLVEEPLITNSLSDDIVPCVTKNGSKYSLAYHGPKPMVAFSPAIYRSFVCFIWLTSKINRSLYLKARKRFALHKNFVLNT